MPNTRARYRVTSSSNASVSPAWDRFTRSNSDTSDCARVASVCMVGRSPPLFHSTPEAAGAEPATPLGTILAHQPDNAVAYFKQSLLQDQVVGSGDQSGGLFSQLHRCVHRSRDRLQGTLQIGDSHPDFIEMITAQRCRQFRAGQSRVGRQLDGGGFILKTGVL